MGVASGPITTSTSYIPLTDMSLTVNSVGGDFLIGYTLNAYNSAANNVYAKLYVDGVAISQGMVYSCPSAALASMMTEELPIYLGVGVHKIDLYWCAGGGTATAVGTLRTLTAIEL